MPSYLSDRNIKTMIKKAEYLTMYFYKIYIFTYINYIYTLYIFTSLNIFYIYVKCICICNKYIGIKYINNIQLCLIYFFIEGKN